MDFCRFVIFALCTLELLQTCQSHRRSKSARQKLFGKNSKDFNNIPINGTAHMDKNQRKGKLFSVFNVITFSNEPCASTSTVNGVNRNGTCFTTTECTDMGGSVNGNCAAGFGVCCVFILDGTNGQNTVNKNCSYIQSTDFPTPVTGAATQTFTVNKIEDDVCFLYLDFLTFTLLGTGGSDNADEGVCLDTFTVMTPTAQVVPVICGENSGEHMIVDIGANSGDTATITVMTSAMAANRLFDIKVTQLECGGASSPFDSSCLQFLTGLTGRFTSYNYANTNDNHLNNQQYSVCIRQEAGFCCVEYSVCPDQLTAVVAGMPQPGYSFDTSRKDSKEDAACVSPMGANTVDYIGIQASGATCAMAGGETGRAVNNRYCGQNLNSSRGRTTNSPICDCTPPFTVDVFFNDISDKDKAAVKGKVNTKHSRGFCLEYRQISC